MLKNLLLALISICLCFTSKSQSGIIYSKLPCNAEVWQVSESKWEEILVCDLNPQDPSSWTWYYNYKGNKKGLLKMKIISQWQDNSGTNILIKIPFNLSKYKLTQVAGTKDLMLVKVEGNMDIPYEKYFNKMQ